MSCHPRVTEWTTMIQAHLPHWTQPHATVLALWSLGICAGPRRCSHGRQGVPGATAGPHRAHRAPAGARVVLRSHRQTRDGARRARCGAVRCAAAGLGRGPVGGHALGPGPRGDDRGHPLYRLGAQCGLSGLCHPRGLDRPDGHGQPCRAPGVVAPAAPGAPGAPTLLDGPGAGRSGLGRPLAVAAHHPAGVAPVCAQQHGRHVAAHGPGRGGPWKTLGPRAGHAC